MPLRFTSDGVPTVCGDETYRPVPFDVTLPDDVEGRAPQPSLRIDNASLEICAQPHRRLPAA